MYAYFTEHTYMYAYLTEHTYMYAYLTGHTYMYAQNAQLPKVRLAPSWCTNLKDLKQLLGNY